MLAIIISAIIITYILLILIFWLGWEKSQPCPDSTIKQGVSILIAVRNEAENIGNLLTDIKQQSYPANLFELIIVDDHSTDATVNKIEEFAAQAPFNMTLLELVESEGKKAAINMAVDKSAHDIIITTDGDCRIDKDWLFTMMNCFSQPEIQLVSGPVRMQPETTFFQRMQNIEFSSLISAGAATLSLDWPTMANGANLAYRKSALEKINSLHGKETSSGDDVFLLHEVGRHYKKALVFCRDERAIVDTVSASIISSFYNQRKRWAGKWQFYHDMPTILLAVFVFMVNLVVLSLPFLVLLEGLPWVLAANLFLLKGIFEYLFLREVQKFFKSKILLHEFIILAIIYPSYVTFVGLAGLVGKYQWKERVTR